MSWFSKELGDGQQAYAPTNSLQEAFWKFFAENKGASEIAMFSRYDLEENMVTVYVSPASETFAKIAGFSPSAPPPRDDLALLVGDQRCWAFFFPPQA